MKSRPLRVVNKTLPLRYEPHPHQAEFHRDRGRVYARLISAGTGGGKTLAGAYECLLWAFELPGSVGYAFEPTYKMVRRNMVPAFETLLGKPLQSSPFLREYHETDSRFTFITGSTLWMIGLEDPESAEGPNTDWIWADEPRLMRHLDTAWQVWVRRLRGSSAKYREVGGIWLTTTPDAPGSFLHKTFEHPVTRLQNSRVYRWGIDDNPHLSEAYRQAVKQAHSGGLAERFVYGRFAAVASGSFAFDYTVHVKAPSEIPTHWMEMRYGVDFGWTNPSAIVAVGLDGDGRAYVLDEFYRSQVRTCDLVSELQGMIARHGPGKVVCDRSEPGTIDALRRAGIPAQADSSKREDGIRALGSRFQKQGDGRPRIYVSPSCVNLISELQTYRADVKENDHAVDALRYAICSPASTPAFF